MVDEKHKDQHLEEEPPVDEDAEVEESTSDNLQAGAYEADEEHGDCHHDGGPEQQKVSAAEAAFQSFADNGYFEGKEPPSGTAPDRTEVTYDDEREVRTIFINGVKVAERVYALGGGLLEDHAFKYTKDGKLESQRTHLFDELGVRTETAYAKYDDKGNIVAEKFREYAEGKGDLTEIETFRRYNIVDGKQQLSEKFKRRFDSRGLRVSETHNTYEHANDTDRITRSETVTFNDRCKKRPELTKETTEYKYDQKGRRVGYTSSLNDALGKPLGTETRQIAYDGDSKEPASIVTTRKNAKGQTLNEERHSYTYKEVNGKKEIATESIMRQSGLNAQPEYKDVQNEYDLATGKLVASHTQTYSDAEKKNLVRLHDADFANGTSHNVHYKRDLKGNLLETTTSDVKIGGESKTIRETFTGDEKTGEQVLTVGKDGSLTLETARYVDGERKAQKPRKIAADQIKLLGDGSVDRAVALLADAGRGDLIEGVHNISKLGGKETDFAKRFELAAQHLGEFGINNSVVSGAEEFKNFGGGDLSKGIDDFIRGGRGDAKKRMNEGMKAWFGGVALSLFGDYGGAAKQFNQALSSGMDDALDRYKKGDADHAQELAERICGKTNKRDFLRGTCRIGFGSGADGLDFYEALGDDDVDRGAEETKKWGDNLEEAADNVQSVGAGSFGRFINVARIYGSKPGEPPSACTGSECILRGGLIQTADELKATDEAGKLTPEQLAAARKNMGPVLDTVAQAGVQPDGTYDPEVGAYNIAEKAGQGNGWKGQTFVTELGRTKNDEGEVVYSAAVGEDRVTHWGEYTDATGKVVRDSRLGYDNWTYMGRVYSIDAQGNITSTYDMRRANQHLERLGRNNNGLEPLEVGVQTTLDLTASIDVSGRKTTDGRNVQRVIDLAGDRAAIEQMVRNGLLPPGTYDFTDRATTNLERIASPDGKKPGLASDAPALLLQTHAGPYGSYTIAPSGYPRSVENSLLAVQNAGNGPPQYRTIEDGITNTAAFVPQGRTQNFLTGAGYVAGLSDKRDSYDAGVRATQSFSATQQFNEGAAVVRDVIGRNNTGQDNLVNGIDQVQRAAYSTTGGNVEQLGRVVLAAGGGDGRVGAQALINNSVSGTFVDGARALKAAIAPPDGKLNETDVGIVATAGNGSLNAGLARLAASNQNGNVRQALDQLQALPPAQQEAMLAFMCAASAELGFKPAKPATDASKPATAGADSTTDQKPPVLAAGQAPGGTIGWLDGSAADVADDPTRPGVPVKPDDVAKAAAELQRVKQTLVEAARAAEEEIRRVEDEVKKYTVHSSEDRTPIVTGKTGTDSGSSWTDTLLRFARIAPGKASEAILWRDSNRTQSILMAANGGTAEADAAGTRGGKYRSFEQSETEKEVFRRMASAVLNVASILADPSFRRMASGTMSAPDSARSSITIANAAFGTLKVSDLRLAPGATAGTANVHLSYFGSGGGRFFEAVGHRWDGSSFNGRYIAAASDRPLGHSIARLPSSQAGPGVAGQVRLDSGLVVPISRRFPVRGGASEVGSLTAALYFTNARVLRGKKKDLSFIGPELALAALFISAGIARARGQQGDPSAAVAADTAPAVKAQELARATADHSQQAGRYRALVRPTWLVRPNENLAALAEHLFRDAKLGWLIADLNAPFTNEMYEGGKRIVELRVRQKIELPVWQDIVDFHERKIDFAIENLVTVVTESAVQSELMQAALAPVMGVVSTPMAPAAVPALRPAQVLQPALAAVVVNVDTGKPAGHGGSVFALPALAKLKAAAQLRGPNDPTAVATVTDEDQAPTLNPKFA